MKKMTDYRSTGSYFQLYDLQSHQKLAQASFASVLQAASLKKKRGRRQSHTRMAYSGKVRF